MMPNIFKQIKQAKQAIQQGKIPGLLLLEVRMIINKPIKEKRLIFHNDKELTYIDKQGEKYSRSYDEMADFIFKQVSKKSMQAVSYMSAIDIKNLLLEEYKKRGSNDDRTK